MVDPLKTHASGPPTVPVEHRFELLKRIGAGNHGVVFRARDHQLQREVAVKRFSHFVADDARAMKRITREVATLARVSHPHVVTVHDLVHMADGDGEVTPHLVMELVEGTSLRDLLATQGPSLRSVVVVRGVLEGLAACHHAGILHLDIKPANVLVTPEGAVKIVDFGIARAASDATATVAGTPHYMAPEQFEGRSDERSDIYSVGCLLYESLTGVPPFQGTMAAQLLAHRSHPRPDPRAYAPEVSPSLAAVVQRAMAIDPAQRFQDVGQMLAGLAAADSTPVTATVPRQVAAETAAVPAPVVSRGDQAKRAVLGLALSTFVVALLPGLAWASLAYVPAGYRPDAWREGMAGTWWVVAVTIAGALLLLRVRAYAGALGRSVSDGPWMAAGAAAVGSVPTLFPWYVVLVAALADAGGLVWPADVLGSSWGIAWVLMPLAAVVLAARGLTRVRPRLGALFASSVYLAAAGFAALLFVAYPHAV